MEHPIRYQAAIMRDDHILLLKVWDHAFTGGTFWVIPGGGQEVGETEEECVCREAREETHLEVAVERLILDEPEIPGMFPAYRRAKTYVCRILSGEEQAGLEPEVDSDERRTIQAVGWFDLRDPEGWDVHARNDPVTVKKLERIRAALGYGEVG